MIELILKAIKLLDEMKFIIFKSDIMTFLFTKSFVKFNTKCFTSLFQPIFKLFHFCIFLKEFYEINKAWPLFFRICCFCLNHLRYNVSNLKLRTCRYKPYIFFWHKKSHIIIGFQVNFNLKYYFFNYVFILLRFINSAVFGCFLLIDCCGKDTLWIDSLSFLFVELVKFLATQLCSSIQLKFIHVIICFQLVILYRRYQFIIFKSNQFFLVFLLYPLVHHLV